MTTRSQDDIAARLWALRASGGDLFGFREEVLVQALDFDHAREFLSPEATAQQWDQQRWSQHSDTETYARWYLRFAIGKILDHRSGSASRSVDKLAELAWLLGRDDVVAAMDAAGYPMYGAPKVIVFADGLGWPTEVLVDDPDDRQALARMAGGRHCSPDGCNRGCGD
ncbi:hypothetical protein [Micromonospora sp. NPDC050200]|uniref:hypothetical protein n=1 Tax=Micromonospora sp. NPDC050200 TaxID=3155664 RepID=UPI00340BB4FE